jgi:hypothetical protein
MYLWYLALHGLKGPIHWLTGSLAGGGPARLQLTPLVFGLVRSGLLQPTLQSYKTAVTEKAKRTVNDAITAEGLT